MASLSSKVTRGASFTLVALLMGALTMPLAPFSVEAASKTKPSITLTSPKSKSTFSKTVDGSIPISWSAENVPENTLVIVELSHKKLAKGGSLGGGMWQDEIAAGTSVGTYNWDIETVGTSDPGTYRVRAFLLQCPSKGCDVNPFFPGEKKTKTYAKSKWVNITITKTGATATSDSTQTESDGTVGVSLSVNGSYADSVTLDPSTTPTFIYTPSGDVESCTVTASFTDGAQSLKHGWKNGVTPGQYGQATFSVANKDGILRSVQVRCKNGTYEATDTIQITVTNTGTTAYKILIGKTGKQTFKKGVGSEAEARAYCSEAYNDPDIHEYTRVQCYWNDTKFMDVKEFKG
jgi:hypothetical protein